MHKATFTFTSRGSKLRREEFEWIDGDGAARLGPALDQTGGALTSFFREADHFDFLKAKIVPALRRRPKARLWCAGAATGEEPYSIVFTLLEALGIGAASRIHVAATDGSIRDLEIANRGVYPENRLAGVPQSVRRRYLLRGHEAAEGHFKVRPEVRRCIEFRLLDLAGKIWHPGRFPVIFCRDALSRLNQETRRDVVNQLIGWLEPGGHLFIGGSERLGGKCHGLASVQPSIYRKPKAPGRRPDRGVERQ